MVLPHGAVGWSAVNDCGISRSYSRTLTLPILKTIINLQTFSVHSCHRSHKGPYTGELHCLLLQPRRQPYLTRSREYFDACGMMVRVSIPVCWTWKSFPPVLALTHTHEP